MQLEGGATNGAEQPLKVTPFAPPAIIATTLASTTRIFSFDVEVHDYIKTGKKKQGRMDSKYNQFALTEDCNLKYSRPIQFGWADGECGEQPTVKQVLVQPAGYKVSSLATDYHGITDAQARHEGVPILNALESFAAAFMAAHAKGALFIAHQISYDAEIISQEMGRCGLHDMQQLWERIISTRGFCTMSPIVGKWVLSCANQQTKEDGQHALGLGKIASYVAPEWKHLAGTEGSHDAGRDAQLAFYVFAALAHRAKEFQK